MMKYPIPTCCGAAAVLVLLFGIAVLSLPVTILKCGRMPHKLETSACATACAATRFQGNSTST
jgi:hypothetical protein